MQPFVDLAWLEAHRAEVVLADVRWYLDGRSGREAYERGHIPGAVYVDLDSQLAGPAAPGTGRHPLPEPGAFAEAMSGAGIGDGDTVIAYDDAGGVIAARLAWMLRTLGRPAAVLDGGLGAYGGDQQRGPAAPGRPAIFTPRPWPADRLATLAEVTDGHFLLLDARDGARYRGEHEPVDPRGGHVPGARSLPARENLDATGRVLGRDELRLRFEAAGVSEGGDVICYCGSGVTACHDLLALEHAGLGPGRLFPGSWSQYSADPRLPVATGAEP